MQGLQTILITRNLIRNQQSQRISVTSIRYHLVQWVWIVQGNPIAFCGTPWKYIFRLESTFLVIYELVVKHFMVILNDSTRIPVFLAIISKANSKDRVYSTLFFFSVIPMQLQFVLPQPKIP